MKKLLLLIFLMTISLGQSQSLRLGFESGESGNTNSPFGDFAIQPVEAGTGSNTSLVLPIIANPTGQPWQGCNFVLTSPVELIATKTMTIDVLSFVPVTFLMKVAGGVAGALEAAAQASHNGDGTWQTISFTFNTSLDGKAAQANGVYNNMVIHPFFPFPFASGASAQTFYIDNISGPAVTPPSDNCTNGIKDGTETGIDCGGSCAVCPPFTVAAPTPTQAAEDVISVFSNTYTNLANTEFFPGWGQSTQYSQFSPVVGNPTLKYSNLNYQGNQFASPINASAMQNLHIDIWTPDCTSFQVFLISPGSESPVTITPSLSGWNSYDIPLSSYPAVNKANLIQFKYVGSGTVYLDNIYFWKVPAGTNIYYADADGDGYGAGAASLSTATTAPAGYSVNNTDCNDTKAGVNPGATEVLNSIDDDCDGLVDEGLLPTIPTTDAPTAPARNSWDVQSVYSAAYTNYSSVDFFPGWGQTTTFSTYTPEDDETLKYSNLTFQGIDFNGSKNISAMTKLHLDVWTPDMSSFQVALVAGGENAVTLTPSQSGWNSFDLDLATKYAGRNLSAAIQLKLERTLWTPSDGNVNSLYVDNIYFYRPATTLPPTLGTFTVPAKVAGDASFDLTAPTSNGTGAFTYTSSNAGVATISGSTVTIVGAGSSTITATQAAAGIYAAISVIATLEVSLAAAAPIPTVPGDRVLSIFSGAPGYSDVAGTQWRPNWGQSTQYNLVNVVGNPTIKYSNLNYEGVQLDSPVDATSYTTLHIDVYGAGTSAVDFYAINQAGGAGSPLQQIEANTPLTLQPGVWNSFDIELSSLTGLELNRIGQFKFVGSGTIYVDNIYFSKATPSHTTAPTVADVTYCKGAIASNLTATAIGTNLLNWYSTATIATALTATPKPATTTSGTKKYYVAQVMSDGFVSPRAEITVTVTTDVTPIVSSTLTLKNSSGATVTAIGPFIGTSTEFTLEASLSSTPLATYQWTLPSGVNQVLSDLNGGVHDRIITVKFDGVGKGITSLPISVQSTNSAGCLSGKKTLSLTRALPAAPAAIKMKDASIPVAEGASPVNITSFAKYMGTGTELTLTATETASVTSYIWELPTGVNITKGSATTVDGVTSSTSNVITVNFEGVLSSNTYNYATTALVSTNVLRIGVKSVNGVGISTTANTTLANSSLDFYPNTTSTAKLLSLTAIAPAAPSALALNNGDTATAITAISKFIGQGGTYRLSASTSALASSYSWILPACVTRVTSLTDSSTASGTTTDPYIYVKFNGTNPLAGSIYFGVKAINGVGSSNSSVANAAVLGDYTSSTFKLLKLTTAVPAAVGATGFSGQIALVCPGGLGYNYTITTAPTLANFYLITGPIGSTVSSTNGIPGTTPNVLATTDLNFNVVYGTAIVTADNKLTIKSGNAMGLSSALSKTLTKGTCTSNGRLSQTSNVSVTGMYPNPTTDSFNLELSATKSADVSVTVYSFDGMVVSSKNVQLSEGTNVLNEDLSSQREGIYIVKIIDSLTGLETIKKIIKQ